MTIKPIIHQVILELSPTPDLAKQVEKTISRYAKPTGCCSAIVYLLNRIKNMVLSLFGCSDWQRTVRAMRKEFNSVIENKFQVLTQDLNLPKKLQNETLKLLNPQLSPIPGGSLKTLLKLQNAKSADDLVIVTKYNEFAGQLKKLETTGAPLLYNAFKEAIALGPIDQVKLKQILQLN